MTEEEARKFAARRAYQLPAIEEHIQREAFKEKPTCRCGACYWRRVHVAKLMREEPEPR